MDQDEEQSYLKDDNQEWIPVQCEFRECQRTGPLPGTWVRLTENILILTKNLRKCSICGIICNRWCTARGIAIHRECEEFSGSI